MDAEECHFESGFFESVFVIAFSLPAGCFGLAVAQWQCMSAVPWTPGASGG